MTFLGAANSSFYYAGGMRSASRIYEFKRKGTCRMARRSTRWQMNRRQLKVGQKKQPKVGYVGEIDTSRSVKHSVALWPSIELSVRGHFLAGRDRTENSEENAQCQSALCRRTGFAMPKTPQNCAVFRHHSVGGRKFSVS